KISREKYLQRKPFDYLTFEGDQIDPLPAKGTGRINPIRFFSHISGNCSGRVSCFPVIFMRFYVTAVL
ncbi:MAG: hypothetical protein IIY37_00260, partial [Selenomonadaceae bacterium]|nr:hypothetical protein [Selenomonadaceae bacterium]